MNIENKKLLDTLKIMGVHVKEELGRKILMSDVNVTSYFKALRKLGLDIGFIIMMLSEIVCLYGFTQEEFDCLYRRLKLINNYTCSDYTSIVLDIMLQLIDKDRDERIETLNACNMGLDADIDHIEDKNGNDYILFREDKKVRVYLEDKEIEDDLYCFIISEDGIEVVGNAEKERATKDKLKIFIKGCEVKNE